MGIQPKKIWSQGKILGAGNMIFVTIGMVYGFNRLIKKMDEISQTIDEDVVMQIGESSYLPKNTKYFRYASKKDINKYYEEARIIVCHSGIGSIMVGLDSGKPIMVIPRLKIYGEAVDDHQVEIAKELQKRGKINVCYNIEDLEILLKNIKEINKDNIKHNKSSLVINLEIFLKSLEM